MRSRKSVVAWYKRMREIEQKSARRERQKADREKARLAYQIEHGQHRPLDAPKGRLIKRDRHRQTDTGSQQRTEAAPVETKGKP